MPTIDANRLVVLGLLLAGRSLAQAPIEVRTIPFWHGRVGYQLVLDPDRGRVVLFGHSDILNRDPVWEWDGTRWAYIEPRGPAPSPRYAHGMAFDPVRRRVLVFGGYDGYFTLFDDTWAWDGRAWTQLAPATRPQARWGHTMVTDEMRGRIVMFGGSLFAGWGGGSDETWEWDGQDWIQVSTVVRPPLRTAQDMAYDHQARNVLMYGGWTGVVPYGDTWAYDGSAWQQLSAGDPRLTPRVGHAMATDVRSGRVVLYGGHEGGGAGLSDTWTWNGSGWQPEAAGPPGHGSGRLAADGQRVILFGGWDSRSTVPPLDTWGWDGRTWSQLDDPGYLGHYPGYNMVAYHGGLEAFVVGLTSPNQPPVFQVVGNDGVLRHAGPIPPNGLGHIAYDVARDRLVGLDRSFTTAWAWDGRTWTRLPDPPSMGLPSASWWEPRARRLVYLQRSAQRLIDWDGTAWSQRSIAGVPMTREAVIVAHDPERDRLLAYGGKFQQTFFPETWEWDGSSWTLLDANGPFRAAVAMVHSGHPHGMLLMLGGAWRDIWRWNGTHWTLLAPNALRGLGEGNLSLVAVDPRRQRLLLSHSGLAPFYPPLDEISLAPLRADQPYPRLGETVTLSAELPDEGGHVLAVGLSTAVDPGIPVRPNASGTWDLFPVAATPLLFASMQTTSIDVGGKASVAFRVPVNRSLWWTRLYGAGIAIRPGLGLGAITNAAKLWVVR